MDQYDQYDSSSSSYHSDSGEGGGGSSSYIRLSSRLLSNLTSSLLTSEPTIVSQVLAANVAAAAAASTASGHTLNMLNDTPLSTTTTTTSGGSGTFGTGNGTNSSGGGGGGGGSGGYVPYEARPETYIVPLIFLLIFVLGTIGNGTVIYIFYQHKSMRTVANVYILSLAAGDLALIFISVPFVSTIYTFESWPYGLLVCKISEFARDLSIGVTVFTLTTLSVQRYTATHHPIRYLSHKGRNTLTQANTFIWLLSILLAAPGAYNSYMLEFQVEPGHKVKVCYPFPEHLGPWYSKVMVLTKFLAYYVIPLVVISVFYTLMARSLIRTTENPVGTNESQHKLLRNRKKISKIVLGLVVIFAICFFPNQIFMLWFYFDPQANEHYNAFWHVWRIFGFVLSFLNSCLNPIVLCCISGVFRSHFKRYIFSCFYRPMHRPRETSLTLPGFRSINSIDMNTTKQQMISQSATGVTPGGTFI